MIDNILFARYGLGMLESKSQEWKRPPSEPFAEKEKP